MAKSKKTSATNQSLKPEVGSSPLYALEEEGGKIVRKPILQNTYRKVGDEVLTEQLDPECWAKALATGVKTKDEALSMYAKMRAEDLAGEVSLKESKALALEERRLVAGAPDSDFETKIVWKKRFSLMWDFLFWQILLSVSGVGLFLALLAMGQDSRWWPGLLPLVVISACLQLSPVICYGFGKFLLGRMSYTRALGVTAVILVSLSALIGVQTMMGKSSPRWLQAALNRAVETTDPVAEPSPLLGEEF